MEHVSGFYKSSYSSHSQSPSLSLYGSSSSLVPAVKGNLLLDSSNFLTNSKFEIGIRDQDYGKSRSSYYGYQDSGCSLRSRYVNRKTSPD